MNKSSSVKRNNKQVNLEFQKKSKGILLGDFFGKLPGIKDGLKYQRKLRGEWK